MPEPTPDDTASQTPEKPASTATRVLATVVTLTERYLPPWASAIVTGILTAAAQLLTFMQGFPQQINSIQAIEHIVANPNLSTLLPAPLVALATWFIRRARPDSEDTVTPARQSFLATPAAVAAASSVSESSAPVESLTHDVRSSLREKVGSRAGPGGPVAIDIDVSEPEPTPTPTPTPPPADEEDGWVPAPSDQTMEAQVAACIKLMAQMDTRLKLAVAREDRLRRDYDEHRVNTDLARQGDVSRMNRRIDKVVTELGRRRQRLYAQASEGFLADRIDRIEQVLVEAGMDSTEMREFSEQLAMEDEEGEQAPGRPSHEIHMFGAEDDPPAILFTDTDTDTDTDTEADLTQAVPPTGDAALDRSTDTPLSIRQNNPGNIEATTGGRTPWQGELPSANRYAVFASPELGIRAMMYLLLFAYHEKGFDTLGKIISRWAPHGDNTEAEVENYIVFVSMSMASRPDIPLALPYRPMQLISLVKAMGRVEAGQDLPYTERTYVEALFLLPQDRLDAQFRTIADEMTGTL